jgi:Fe-S cluster biogenesis protein NfuA
MSPCREALNARIAEINALMRAHAGGVELVDVSVDGAVSVRFAGKCTGCELRPLTLAGTVRPALLALDGVNRVMAVGVRISEEAEQRLAESLGPEHDRVLRLLHSRGGGMVEGAAWKRPPSS